MPMYEYTCLDCGKNSTIVVTLKQHEKGEVQCPSCGSTKLQQRFSPFIAHTTKKS
ncbi:MAG TPA: FmdB family zinc ribbon protein [Nitrospiraceae bacterium]|jgi:putative FmdB family regulatory protein|nr:FmdB family zinc ribbon protein [Nitrospiraceae bacterium]